MEATLFVIDEHNRLDKRQLTGSDVVDSVPAVWVDLFQFDSAELVQFLEPFSLDDLVLEALDSKRTTSHVAIYQNALLLQFPALSADGKRSPLSILLVDQSIITFHHEKLPALENVADQFQKAPLRSGDPATLLFELIDGFVDGDIVGALNLRREVDSLEQRLDENDDNFDLDQVNQLRRQIVSLEALMEDQRRCFGGLQTSPPELIGVAEFHEYLRDTISHLDHNIRVAGRMEDRLAAIQQHYILKLQDKQNEKLQLLTVVSAIFLPLMLVTGIYGMNFHYMP